MINSPLEDIEAAALQLAPAERAKLAERLLVSLDEDDEILATWVDAFILQWINAMKYTIDTGGDTSVSLAPNITCPVLFMVQWDDERFDRDGAFELFDARGSADKRLHAHPGLQAELPAGGRDATREFLARYLA